MADKLKIGIILGSVRDGRFGDKPANWIKDHCDARDDIDATLIDLKDHPMPFVHDEKIPAVQTSRDPKVQEFLKIIDAQDGFIFVTAEYNGGPPASLKNAIDHGAGEWKRKPAAFVGYGGVGGARAIQSLQPACINLAMAPIASWVNILWPDYLEASKGKALSEFPHLEKSAKGLLDNLIWWGGALKAARG